MSTQLVPPVMHCSGKSCISAQRSGETSSEVMGKVDDVDSGRTVVAGCHVPCDPIGRVGRDKEDGLDVGRIRGGEAGAAVERAVCDLIIAGRGAGIIGFGPHPSGGVPPV